MSPIILPVPHLPQPYPGECLAACSAMSLTYLGIPVSYKSLLNLLQIKRGFGTASSNIRALKQLGVTVVYEQGTFDELYHHLNNNHPCIAFVEAGELPYWHEASSHAVLVVGLETEFVYLNDPAVAVAPIRVPWGDFDLACLEHDEFYATFTG